MPDRLRIGLDNPAFSGRLRVAQYPSGQQAMEEWAARTAAQPEVADMVEQLPAEPVVVAVPAPSPSPPASPPAPSLPPIEPELPSFPEYVAARLRRTKAGKRLLDILISGRQIVATVFSHLQTLGRVQQALVVMACLVFVTGAAVNWQTLRTNHAAVAQVAALAKQVTANNKGSSTPAGASVPSTVPISHQVVSSYTVAPDLPRYLKIPKLGVDARVMQVGLTKDGALGTPNNVFDTAWYTGSAKPGQPGATLIDGHVSSWTSHGVFYSIKKLVAGDAIQIVKGDGSVVNYQVVRTQVYGANNVDMQAAVTPVAPGVSGLNLITCTGQVKPGTSEFNERVIVFAQQV